MKEYIVSVKIIHPPPVSHWHTFSYSKTPNARGTLSSLMYTLLWLTYIQRYMTSFLFTSLSDMSLEKDNVLLSQRFKTIHPGQKSDIFFRLEFSLKETSIFPLLFRQLPTVLVEIIVTVSYNMRVNFGNLNSDIARGIDDGIRIMRRWVVTCLFFSFIGLFYGYMSTNFFDLFWKVLGSSIPAILIFNLRFSSNVERNDVIPYVFHGSLGLAAGLTSGGVLASVPLTAFFFFIGFCVLAGIVQSI